MNPRSTKILVLLAAALFAFIFFFERHAEKTGDAARPARILPGLKPAAVTAVQIRTSNQPEIFAARSSEGWQISRPFAANAQAAAVENLIEALAQASWRSRLTSQDVQQHDNADREFGFEPPQATIEIIQSGQHWKLQVGAATATGDELFVRVAGVDEIYVADGLLLKFFPRNANDWRDPSLVNLKNIAFDRILVTNKSKAIEFQRDAASQLWRLVRPVEARADNPKIDALLAQLQKFRVSKFITDDPKADLDTYGLSPADLELTLAQGTNIQLSLEFGKSPAKDATQIYVHRAGQTGVGLIAADQPAPWRGLPEDFRDRRLADLSATSFDQIESRGAANFILQRAADASWQVLAPEKIPADIALVRDWLGSLGSLQATQFVKAVVTELGWTNYGLAPPASQIFLRTGASNTAVALDFSAAQADGRVFARRADETSVYAVRPEDLRKLAVAGWQLRDRQLWDFSENDVTRLAVTQRGVTRELLRAGTNQWSFAPGSQGVINVFAIEETAHRLGALSADAWLARGDAERARHGLADAWRISVDVKRKDKAETLVLDFAPAANGRPASGAITLDGQLWIFEFPQALGELLAGYLATPAATP